MSQELDKTEDIETNEQDKNQEFDVKKILAQMEQMQKTNERLLEESKTWKSKYKGLSTDVEQKQKADLEKTENWKDLLEIEKNQKMELKSQLQDTRKAVLQKELNFKVASVAKDAFDVNDIITSLPKDILAIDEENLSVTGVEEAVNMVRENKPWLFQKENKSGMSSARPAGDGGKRGYDELTDAEKEKAFGDALSQLF